MVGVGLLKLYSTLRDLPMGEVSVRSNRAVRNKRRYVYSVECILPLYIELLLDNPGSIVPHPLFEQQVLHDTFRLNRRCDPTSGQGLNRFKTCEHIHIKGIARAKRLQAEVSFHGADTDKPHR